MRKEMVTNLFFTQPSSALGGCLQPSTFCCSLKTQKIFNLSGLSTASSHSLSSIHLHALHLHKRASTAKQTWMEDGTCQASVFILGPFLLWHASGATANLSELVVCSAARRTKILLLRRACTPDASESHRSTLQCAQSI